ncbi:putative nuclease HARBI1 [Armadillidium vulgare]|nr:putative nuclease HARBI1 [Armadillidium vulgare]
MDNFLAVILLLEEEEMDRNEPKEVECSDFKISNMPSEDFKIHFRLTKQQFETLFTEMKPVHMKSPSILRGWPLKKLMLASLWVLSSLESYRSIAERFGTVQSVVSRWVHYFTRLICYAKNNVIKWPSEEEKLQNVTQFLERGFPDTVGALNVTQITIKKPKELPESYYTDKKVYAINCMAVCNASKKFFYVYIGDPGSYSKRRTFRRSGIGRKFQENKDFLQPYHIIGDNFFPFSSSLMVPYKGFSHLNYSQIRFNDRLQSARMVIEHAFDLLKQRFRRLQYLEMYNIDDISSTILACCIMHNLITGPVEDDGDEEIIEEIRFRENNKEYVEGEDDLSDDDEDHSSQSLELQKATEKRNKIAMDIL